MGWIRDVSGLGLPLCEALDIVHQGPGRPPSYGPCPACGAVARSESSSSDKRLALVSAHGGKGWWCPRCEASGDAADLISLHVIGVRMSEASREQRSDVRRWLAAKIPEAMDAAPEVRPASAPAPLEPPPADEVRALWSSAWDFSGPPLADPAVDYAARRGDAPIGVIAQTGLVRLLGPRESFARPGWWPYSNAWRLVFGLYDPDGQLRSVVSRTHSPEEARKKGKERSPFGFGRQRLLLADALGQDLLAGRGRAGALVWIVEGPTSALALACAMAQHGRRDPVLAGFPGSWSALADVRWPKGALIVIATDDDKAGHAYAAKIRASVPALIPCRRVHWSRLESAAHA